MAARAAKAFALLACLMAASSAAARTQVVAPNTDVDLPSGGRARLHATYVQQARKGSQSRPATIIPPSLNVPTTFSDQLYEAQIGQPDAGADAATTTTSVLRAASVGDTMSNKARSLLSSVYSYFHHEVEEVATHGRPCWKHPMDAAHAHTEYRKLQASNPLPIKYHDGAVMTSGVNVYMIYIGYNSNDNTPRWLNYLVANLGATRWWKAVQQWYGTPSVPTMTGKLRLAGTTYVQYMDKVVDGNRADDVAAIALAAMDSGLVARDYEKGLYVVVPATGAGVIPSAGAADFCASTCGWHNYWNVAGSNSPMKIAFIPPCCPSDAFTGNGATSPAGNTLIDGMADTLAHEIAEAASDPETSAWFDDKGEENADKCNSNYGTPSQPQLFGRSVTFTQVVGGYPYLIQQMWNPKVSSRTGQQIGCQQGL